MGALRLPLLFPPRELGNLLPSICFGWNGRESSEQSIKPGNYRKKGERLALLSAKQMLDFPVERWRELLPHHQLTQEVFHSKGVS